MAGRKKHEENPDKTIHYTLQLKICCADKFFGPGIAELMLLIDKYHSIQKATDEMGIAYSKAWRILKDAERNLGFPLLDKIVGGIGGGSSTLTEQGRTFLNNYLSFEKDLHENADKLFLKYFLKEV